MKYYRWIKWDNEVMVALFNDENPHEDKIPFTVSGNDYPFFLVRANGVVTNVHSNRQFGSLEVLNDIAPPYAAEETVPDADMPTLRRIHAFNPVDGHPLKFRQCEDAWQIKQEPDGVWTDLPPDITDAIYVASEHSNLGVAQVAWLIGLLHSHG